MLTGKALSAQLSEASIQAMERLSVKAFADSVEQLYQKILDSGERPKRISAPVIPLVIGAKAAKGITKIPRMMARRSHKVANHLFAASKK